MEINIARALQHILERFHGMEFNSETMDYMEMEVNDCMKRLFPDFNQNYYVIPFYNKSTKSVRFLPTRKH